MTVLSISVSSVPAQGLVEKYLLIHICKMDDLMRINELTHII